MKTLATATVLVFALTTINCSRHEPASHATHGAHEGHAAAAEPPVLPAGELWATDEPLRAAMLGIHAAVAKLAPAYDSHELKAADAQGLAATVEENVASMIANCKLEPKPDAALHVLIARMMSAAGSLKRDPAASAGFPELLSVLQDYQATFDHPGWPAVHAH